MPFTPYHMGPGLLIKSVLQGSFSLMIFGWAQVVMDIQPLIVLLTGKGHLHGFSHTFLGATVLSFFAALTGKYLFETSMKIIGTISVFNPMPVQLTWRIVIISALIGTYSHVLLDSIMHGDMAPYFPLAIENKLLGIITIDQLHRLCWYSGVAGVVIYGMVWLKVRNA